MYFKNVTSFIEDERGTTAIEYALIGALVSIIMVIALGALGQSLSDTFTSVNAGLTGVSSFPPSGPPQARP